MKTTKKLQNQYTINTDDETRAQIEKIAEYYQRKPAELLRLLITPVLIDEYAKIQKLIHTENAQPLEKAIFKG